MIGETLTVNNQPLTIVGVAAEGFDGAMPGTSPAVFVPLTLRWLVQPDAPRNDGDRSAYWLYLFGRLLPGVSREQAAVALNDVYRRILREVVAPLLTGITAEQRQAFLDRVLTVHDGRRGQSYAGFEAGNRATLLFGASLAVLLIVCVNVANLLLANGAAQAGRVLAVGVAVGLVLVLPVGRLAEAFLFGLTGYDPVVLITALGVVAAVVVAAAYLPAARAARLAPMEALRHE